MFNDVYWGQGKKTRDFFLVTPIHWKFFFAFNICSVFRPDVNQIRLRSSQLNWGPYWEVLTFEVLGKKSEEFISLNMNLSATLAPLYFHKYWSSYFQRFFENKIVKYIVIVSLEIAFHVVIKFFIRFCFLNYTKTSYGVKTPRI